MIYYNDVIFSKEECVDILNSATNFVESGLDVVVNNVDYGWTANTNKRKSSQCELVATSNSFVYTRLNEIVNKCGYNLICDELPYDIIKYKEGDFIWKHKDDKGTRLLSFVIQLNEGDTYEGGDFAYWLGDTELSMGRDVGVGMVFKTGVYHEVKPITKGIRHSFVTFIKYADVSQKGGRGLI